MKPYDAIRQVLVEHIGVEPDAITPETLLADLDLDSFDRLEIQLEVEALTDHFATDEDIEIAQTVGALAAAFTKEAA